MRRLILLSVLGAMVASGCDYVYDLPDGDRSGRVHLQNMADHSGVTVRLLELDESAVYTDAEGRFTVEAIPDGGYTLRARYPYFASEETAVEIQDDRFQTPVDLELEQQLQFWIEPADTTIAAGEDLSGLTLNAANVSEEPVTVGTVEGYRYVQAYEPQGTPWPRFDNPSISPDSCYKRLGWFGLSYPYSIDLGASFTYQPGDTISTTYLSELGFSRLDILGSGERRWFSAKSPSNMGRVEGFFDAADPFFTRPILGKSSSKAARCFPGEDTYLFFAAPSDQANYPDYFEADYFWSGSASSPQPYNRLNRTLLRKKNLFRPVRLHLAK